MKGRGREGGREGELRRERIGRKKRENSERTRGKVGERERVRAG